VELTSQLINFPVEYSMSSRKEEEFYFDAFLAMLTNKIKIEKHKSKSQINM